MYEATDNIENSQLTPMSTSQTRLFICIHNTHITYDECALRMHRADDILNRFCMESHTIYAYCQRSTTHKRRVYQTVFYFIFAFHESCHFDKITNKSPCNSSNRFYVNNLLFGFNVVYCIACILGATFAIFQYAFFLLNAVIFTFCFSLYWNRFSIC